MKRLITANIVGNDRKMPDCVKDFIERASDSPTPREWKPSVSSRFFIDNVPIRRLLRALASGKYGSMIADSSAANASIEGRQLSATIHQLLFITNLMCS
jgi:hypothetical protein